MVAALEALLPRMVGGRAVLLLGMAAAPGALLPWTEAVEERPPMGCQNLQGMTCIVGSNLPYECCKPGEGTCVPDFPGGTIGLCKKGAVVLTDGTQVEVTLP